MVLLTHNTSKALLMQNNQTMVRPLLDVEEFYRVAAIDSRSPYAGQLTPEFQAALRDYHHGVSIADCSFYHTMKFPDGSVLEGEWDLRGGETDYLGDFGFAGKRVLEVGPASGHLTYWMENEGASVVSFDLPFDASPAMVPTPGVDTVHYSASARENMRRVRNSWWYSHSRYGSAAQAVYGDVRRLPPDLGRFDAAVFAAVLVHLPDPFGALQQAASFVDETLIVVEPNFRGPTIQFNPPAPMPIRLVFWWSLPASEIERMLMALGFTETRITTHQQKQRPSAGGELELTDWFTIVAHRPRESSVIVSQGHNASRIERPPVLAAEVENQAKAASEATLALKVDPLPTPALRFLVAGTEDPEVFSNLGQQAFGALTGSLRRNGVDIPSLESVLDFGCGVGRVARHWQRWPELRIHGVDINPDLVAWCSQNLQFGKFERNELAGPLDFSDGSFGLVYALSVFTHLPAALQMPWFQELVRIVKPGGYLYFTVHGMRCVHYLDDEGRAKFFKGELVVLGEDAPGSNKCAAFHPPAYVSRRFVDGFGLHLVEHLVGGAAGNPPQDSYLVRKPFSA